MSCTDTPAQCSNCGRVFSNFLFRVIATNQGEETFLVDASDGEKILEIVLVCRQCLTVFRWHEKDKTLQKHANAFNRLMEFAENKK